MKLASLKEGGRDGTLIIANQDLTLAARVSEVAPTLRSALENWSDCEARLRKAYEDLVQGRLRGAFRLDPTTLAAPLPRAFQWIDGSAYLHHAELVRRARNAEMPESLYSDPLVYQGGSDSFIGPQDDILIEKEEWGIDLEGEVAVITGDVPMGIDAKAAAGHIKLVLLVNDVSLRNLMPTELAKGFGFLVSKPATAFSPVAVTPDELGAGWDGSKIGFDLRCYVNDDLLGHPNAAVDLYFDFPTLIAHAAKTRELKAGTIVGSGTVSNRDAARGSACLQEKRMREKITSGDMLTPLLRFGDRVRIEMLGAEGNSIFGAIDQRVVRYSHSEANGNAA